MSQIDEPNNLSRKGRGKPDRGTHRHTEQLAKQIGISVRQAYRLTNDGCCGEDLRCKQQLLLARYMLLQSSDPCYASVMTAFVDDLVQALLEETTVLHPADIDRRWGQHAGRQIARTVLAAAERRATTLSEALDKSHFPT